MAPITLISASAGGVAGLKLAPMARSFVPGSDLVKTGVVAGGGVVVAIGGAAMHSKGGAAGYVGAAAFGTGVGLTLGAVLDHFGW